MKGSQAGVSKITTVASFVFLGLLALTMLVPLVWMICTSLMTRSEVLGGTLSVLPKVPQWQNYPKALTILPFWRFFLNSVIMTGSVVALQLAICSSAAYAFARLRFPGRRKLFMLYLATLMVPPVVTIIPAFLLIVELGWNNSFPALIAPFAGSVWGIFLLRQFFLGLPRDIEDAARIDGAGELTIFFRIILPLSKPVLATLAVFAATSTWQEFLWPLIVTDSMDMRPISVGVALYATQYELSPHYQMAAAVAAMIPMLAVFFFAQRYLVRGIALTGIKE